MSVPASGPPLSETPVLLAPGRVLGGRWEIGEELGRGGTSIVYAARDVGSGRGVAVKLLVPPPAAVRLARLRMEREVVALRRLSHPAIVEILDVVEETAYPCLVMERVVGGDLAAAVGARSVLPPEGAAAVVREVASALSYAHGKGILHRDVKPQNILLDGEGRARLTDFGSAWVEGQTTLTQSGAFVGTLDYVAPEVVSGRRGDARSDVYSLGLTLYFALTGTLPRRPSARVPLAPAPGGHHPAEVSSDVPPWLDSAVARATAADPSDRFPTAAAFSRALSNTGRSIPVDASRPVARTGSPSCRVCGGPDPLGLSPCLACGEAGTSEKTVLLFVAPGAGWEARRRLFDELARILPGRTRSERLEEVASGRRALVRVPALDLRRVEKHLGARGIPVRRSTRRGVVRAVPGGFWALIVAILAAGSAAGTLASPVLLVTTPAVAAALSVAVLAWAACPAVSPEPVAAPLPPSLRNLVARTAASLGDGPVRDLVLDIAGAARSLLAGARVAAAPGLFPELVPALVESSCEAAREIEGLEKTLERLEEHATLPLSKPQDWITATSRCGQARDLLVHDLLEALASLGASQSDLALGPEGSVESLAVCVHRLRDETRIQVRVASELSAVLAANGR